MGKHLAHFFAAFQYSMAGFRDTWASEMAFRQEVILACILVPGAMILPVPLLAKLYLIGAMLLVLITELLNSGLEAIVDLASPEKHPLAKKAKDCGSAAVFIALVHLGAAWGLTLFNLTR